MTKEKQKVKKQSNVQVVDREKNWVDEPKMYSVILENNDIAPMDFVVQILKMVFQKSDQDAVTLMLYIHNNGSGVCGVYTKDIAETKVLQVEHVAQISGYPLKVIIEEQK